MKLVIIEGPGKRDTLKKYLGKDYEVMATKGHVRDLPAKELAVDFNNNFAPKYEIMPDKKELVAELKKKASKMEKVLLATDPDREGEAIAWHISHILGLKEDEACRVEFNEISENVVNKAITMPRTINQSLVDAQQARRVLDRIVGYKLSPILCKKIKSKLSAGRVQSVALKIVVEREKEILAFKPEEFWNVFAYLNKLGNPITFRTSLNSFNGKKIKVVSKEQTDKILQDLNNVKYKVSDIKKSVTKSKALPPFTTSTMQQDAMNKLGMDLNRTSRSAQQLYEGIEFDGEGKIALITYIRTDSVRVSVEAQEKAAEFVKKTYGEKFVPLKYNFYATKKNAQDAHEAIRPISISRTPESVKGKIPSENYRLYKLIYERFIASQMADAIYDSVNVSISAGEYGFKAVGKTLVFPGYTAVYKTYEEIDENDIKEDSDKIPQLEIDDILELKEIKTEQKFTKPPTRYSEGSLVKAMEEKGIGRPATYAPTIMTLSSREYTKKDGKYLVPTELGIIVTDYLCEHFAKVMDIKFTAEMEDKLDTVAEDGKNWQDIIADFWKDFAPFLKDADENSVKIKIPVVETDIVCEKCGAKMVIREGKYGKFLGCSAFPACKNIQKLDSEKKPELKPVSTCPVCGKDVVLRKTKKGKLFYACVGYPDCKFVSWDKPTGEKCPKCGSFLIQKTENDKTIIKCNNSECDFVRE
ncbi:MAG: type I DNA topoisomerase [Clostridia bacterium]